MQTSHDASMTRGQIPGGRAFKAITGIQVTATAVGLPEPITLPDGSKPDAITNLDIFKMAMGDQYEAVLAARGLRPEYPEQVIGLRERRWTHLIGAPATPRRNDDLHRFRRLPGSGRCGHAQRDAQHPHQ